MNNTVNVSENKKSIFKGTLSMGFATFLSRLLGVVRVRLESTVLGGGEVASAWFLAFAIPNLLRRVLGEGALSNALIPLIAENCVNDGTGRVRKQLAVVFSVLSGILLAIVLLVSLFSIVVVKYSASWGVEFFTHPRIVLTFKLLPLLMPYGLFICLAGVVGAILHYSKIFLLPALAALLLNIVLLGGLSAAWYWSMPETQFLPMLALLVPAAGVLQLLMVAIVLVKTGLFPDFRHFWQERNILGKLFKLALPGICGYAALQVSFIIDRAMAASLGDQAIPALTYIDRIVDIFPADQQDQIRIQLSSVLKTVVSQQLLPDTKGGQTPAFEIMHMNSAIRSLIRDSKNHQIAAAIAAGVSQGMVTMDSSILELYRQGTVTRGVALAHADNPDQLLRRMES